MSDLFSYFDNNSGRFIFKWHHYFGIYERHFIAFRNRPIRLLEFGVYQGGSLSAELRLGRKRHVALPRKRGYRPHWQGT